MNTRTILATVLALLAPGATLVAQQQFTPIPGASTATDVTADGQIVVGGGQGGAYFWRWQTDPAPTFIGGMGATGVSDDGSVIVGSIMDPVVNAEVAARWTQATGWVSLGWLPGALSCPSRSNANDVSADGSTVVGLSWNGCSGRGFVWTAANGMQPLGVLANGGNNATHISAGAELIGGFAQGNFSRTPAVWLTNGNGTVFDANVIGEVRGFNTDGSMILGTYDGEAFYMAQGQGLVKFGSLDPAWTGNATDVSADGNTIVGYDSFMLGRNAWLWRPGTGIVSLRDELINLGATNVPSELGVCSSISDDGSIIVGHTTFQGAFVATLTGAKAQKYGCGLNPAASMTVTGVPKLGSVVTLGLDNPLGTQSVGSSTVLMFSVAPDASFPCGIAVPSLGMTPGAPGELLISLGAGQLFLVLNGPQWTGAGHPVQFPLPIPNMPILAGFAVYAQGAIVGLPGDYPLNALTDAVKLQIGY